MSRTEADSWDVASSVGATATMVAAVRAVETREPNPLIEDPFAAPLVRAVGIDFFTKLADGEIAPTDATGATRMTVMVAVRTKFFDDFFLDATAAGVRQAVILASGLDSRAYRLPWPDGTVVYEIDQPEVISFKTATMDSMGAVPSADRRTVAIDLRDDWPAALRRSGFDDTAATAWSAEGLLAYLPPDAQDRLFDNITALSAPGSRLATEFHPDAAANISDRFARISAQWQQHGFDLNLADLFYRGDRSHVVDYLTGLGWQVSARTRPEVFADYGKTFPDTDDLAGLRDSLAIIATRK